MGRTPLLTPNQTLSVPEATILAPSHQDQRTADGIQPRPLGH